MYTSVSLCRTAAPLFVLLLGACAAPDSEQGNTQEADQTGARYQMVHDVLIADGVHPPSGNAEALGMGPGPTTKPGAYGICTYDAARNRTVLFTGRRDEAGDEPATWSWNGNSWTAHAGGQPTAASGFALGYDEQRRVTVLYGGRSMAGEALHQVWEFDGEAWTAVAVHGDSYPPEEAGHFAYDRPSGVLVYMSTGEHPWTWNGSEWHESAASVGSYARKITSSTTDADGHALFLERELGAINARGNPRDVPHLLRYTDKSFRREEAPYADHVYLDTTRDALMYMSFYYESEGAIMGPTYYDAACVSFNASRGRVVTWRPQMSEQVMEAAQVETPLGDGKLLLPFSWSRRVGQRLFVGLPSTITRSVQGTERHASNDLPAGMSLQTGIYEGWLDWTPTADQIGRHEFAVTVTTTGRSGETWTSSEKYVVEVLAE